MKQTKVILPLILAASFVTACGGKTSDPSISTGPVEDDKVHIFVLAGQSGARGKAHNSDLSEFDREPNDHVYIIEDGYQMSVLSNIPTTIKTSAKFSPVAPGFGDSGTEFGPEIGMGLNLASRFPTEGDEKKSVIVKFTACGSTMISDWYSESALKDPALSAKLDKRQVRTNPDTGEETGPLTNNLYQLLERTFGLLADEGYDYVVDGMAFVHGEQDTKFDENMEIYKKGLEYFVQDFRNYVGDQDLPVVISEALTNSGKYSNDLRRIQKEVCDSQNCIFVKNQNLYTNTFEPWHFGAYSNILLGQEIAAALMSQKDTRKLVRPVEDYRSVPLGGDASKVELPEYMHLEYEEGLRGMSKVVYDKKIDLTKEGRQDIPFHTVVNGQPKDAGTYRVIVDDSAYVDGIIDEGNTYASHKVNDDISLYYTETDEGVYFGGTINDDEIWTDGEEWELKDMGQAGVNDDLRIYLTTDDNPANKYTIALSAANLLRVYWKTELDPTNSSLPNANRIYKGFIENYSFRVTTKGIVNSKDKLSEGMTFELFLPYDAFGVEDSSTMKVCFEYSDVSNPNGYAMGEGARNVNSLIYSKGNAGYKLANGYFELSELFAK